MNCSTTPMLDTATAIEQRRSVKHFDPNYTMPEAQIEQLLSLAMLSPTSFNIQNWRFVCVTDPELKKQIRAAAWNQAQVEDASLVVILCADLKAYAKDANRYWANAPQEVQDMLVPMIGKFYDNNVALNRDEGHRSCGMAGQTLMVAAKAMGLDSCPLVGFDFAKVGELINLPADHIISFMVVIGKALQPARARGGQLPYGEVVIQNRF